MNAIKNKFKAIIFDMDGTIIHTEHLWLGATKQLMYDRGYTSFTPTQQEVLDSLGGSGLTSCLTIIKDAFELPETVETLVEETKINAHKLFSKNIEFIDGFETFHKKLQIHGIKSSIATNADQKSLNVLSKLMDLNNFFGTHMYCVDNVKNPKPDPGLFLHASRKLNVTPSECVVFEDSIYGFQAAKAAGMTCIAIKNTQNTHLIDDYANASVESYYDAEKALQSLVGNKE